MPESFLFLHFLGLRSNLTQSYWISSQASDFLLIAVCYNYYQINCVQNSDPIIMQEERTGTSQEQEVLACCGWLKMALGSDTQSIRAGEEGLAGLSRNPQFIKILLSVPLLPDIPYYIAKLATNYTHTYIRSLQVAQKQSTLVATAYHMIDFLSIPALPFPLKHQISQSLIYLLQREKSKSLLLSSEQKLLQLLNSTTISEHVDDIKFEFIALFSHILIHSVPMPIINHAQFLMHSFTSIVKICGVLVRFMQPAINEGKDNVQFCFQLLNLFLDTIRMYLKKLRMLGNQIVHLLNSKQIKQLIDLVLGLSLPGNTLSYPVFYHQKNETHSRSLVYKFHKSKQKVLQTLNETLTILLHLTEDTEHKSLQLMGQAKVLIAIFISAMNELLDHKNYYQLDGVMMEVMGELYRDLGIMVNCKLHYEALVSVKTKLIYGVIFRTLMFSPQDYLNFSADPDQFVNSLYQIIDYEPEKEKEKTIKAPTSVESQPNQQEHIQVELFDTIKTLAANLLISYTGHIDGTLYELIVMALSIMDSQTVQTKYRKDQFLLLLCIVRRNVAFMENLKFKIGQVLVISLRLRGLPVRGKEMGEINYDNVEYGMLLTAIDCYLPMILQYAELLCQSLLAVVESIITNQEVEESVKLLALGVLNKIATNDDLNNNSEKVIQLLWRTLTPSAVNIRSLDCLETMIKEAMYRGGKDAMKEMEEAESGKKQQMARIGEALVQLIQHYSANKHEKIMVDKLWNLLIEITANTHHMPALIPQLRHMFHSLLQVQNQEVVPTDKICRCLCNILKTSTTLTQLQHNYVLLIFKQFYHGQAKCSLSEHFDLLQHLIYYGLNQLPSPTTEPTTFTQDSKGSTKTIELLLEMCIVSTRQDNVDGLPRGESECCEGILLMQSLIIAVGKTFGKQVWWAILECLCSKYKLDSTYDFTKTEVATNLLLVVVYAYNYFDHNLISQLLQQLMKNLSYFTYKNSSKLFTIGLIELLPLTAVPFVQHHYTRILDSIVSMLKLTQLGKDNQLDAQGLDSEETHFYRLKSMTYNCFAQLDEFYLFQKEIEKVRETGGELLEKAEKELSQNKKQFLREILSVRKIGKNTRVIYKLRSR